MSISPHIEQVNDVNIIKTLTCSSIVVCPGTHNDGWTAVATITMRFGNGVAIDLNRGELKVWTVAEDEKEKEEEKKLVSIPHTCTVLDHIFTS